MIVIVMMVVAIAYILFDGLSMDDAVVILAVAFVLGMVITVINAPSGYGFIQ